MESLCSSNCSSTELVNTISDFDGKKDAEPMENSHEEHDNFDSTTNLRNGGTGQNVSDDESWIDEPDERPVDSESLEDLETGQCEDDEDFTGQNVSDDESWIDEPDERLVDSESLEDLETGQCEDDEDFTGQHVSDEESWIDEPDERFVDSESLEDLETGQCEDAEEFTGITSESLGERMNVERFLEIFNSSSESSLEASQCEALVHALSNRLAVIQGE